MRLRPKPRKVVFMASIVLVANVCTYFFLCRHDVELPHADPAGFRYMQHVLRSGGGFLGLSPLQRCAVHCAFTTLVILCAVILGGAASPLPRRRTATETPRSGAPPPSGEFTPLRT